jgi:CheY-like chemotaxis protein
VHVLLAADADWVINEVVAALGDAQTSFSIVRSGYDVTEAVKQRTPDVAVLDLQIGNMGGMAVTMALRLDESADALPHVPVLMLLDRRADVNLARRSNADGWLIKPLDPLRLRRAAKAIAAGGTYVEGVPIPPPTAVPGEVADAVEETTAAGAETLTVPAEAG